MDGLTLLRDARAAGLSVRTEGERLVIRGPRRAEPVVHVLIAHKPDIMAALALADRAGELNPPALGEAAGNVAQWSGLYREKLQVWQGAGRYTEAEAERLAWGELQCRWHRLYGNRVPASICAGCRHALASTEALDPGDGTKVHFATSDCLILYGDRWRGAASAALAAMGLSPPFAQESDR